ncbi:hypothetical protein [Clostridium intestinale]|uniref:hypothetical protein n=1 Tax=Clostridium intestinale TaxID=36845 RepID=UPI002DD6874F|nr:hypothetical protein [Clostridium intestinale]WRY52770.1 hypothetical protein P8F83_06120 [Clostridium intestinale]
MKKKYLVVGLVFIIILLSMFINFRKSRKISEDTALRHKIVDTIKQSEHVDFSEVTDFEWDTMYIFIPYSNPNNIFKVDGVKSYNSRFSIEQLDSINMIAFVKSEKLVAFVEVPIEYFNSEKTTKYSKD